MSKTKNKPGVHLYKNNDNMYGRALKLKPEWYWHIVASNGRIIARSSETYSRKSAAVKSIKIAAKLFDPLVSKELGAFRVYYDHSKKEDVIL